METFEKYDKERGTVKILNAKVKEIQSLFTKLKKEYEEIEKTVSDLINALITSVDNEVKGTRKTCKILQEIQRFQKRQRGIFNQSYREKHRKGGPIFYSNRIKLWPFRHGKVLQLFRPEA